MIYGLDKIRSILSNSFAVAKDGRTDMALFNDEDGNFHPTIITYQVQMEDSDEGTDEKHEA
jgi:hypothetical protein